MTRIEDTSEKMPDGRRPSPYVAPTMRRLGTLKELTKSRSPAGAKDGGPNNTRSA